MSDNSHLRPFGYADGGYINGCAECQKEFIGDKRAQNCQECAQRAFDAAVDPATDIPKVQTFDVYVDHEPEEAAVGKDFRPDGDYVLKTEHDAAIEKKNDHIRLLQERLKGERAFTRQAIRNAELIDIADGDDRLERTLKQLQTLGHTTGRSLEHFEEDPKPGADPQSLLIFKTSTKDWPKKYKGDHEVVLRADAERIIRHLCNVIVSIEARRKRLVNGSATLENQIIRLEDLVHAANKDRDLLTREKEVMRRAATDYCWERYKGRQPMMLKYEAVFTSHEWQKIGEYMDEKVKEVRNAETSK